ncbi:hypothetical protein [Draconibacterium halophilum]|uniref:Uncharacterized protein n=1 Tax=Draconibacterium halophilum TaxID=2706887 RepID=A0A6C0RHG2_9BACT|nr:hypothetical protein [Draconibacterium halophilum]QIA09487.1 hypothetical protein G0Q07_18025 [Draconibacterium halophilum]
MMGKFFRLIFVAFLIISPVYLLAQGPQLSYYYDINTQLPWASCYLQYENDVKQKIAFFPVINEKTNSPMGIENYSKDVNLESELIFYNGSITENFEFDSIRTSIKDKILVLSDISPDTLDAAKLTPILEEKINYAIDNKASGLIIILCNKTYPLYIVNIDNQIPVINITDAAALPIFEKEGIDYNKMVKKQGNDKLPVLTELRVKLKLNIDGDFSSSETKNFNYKYLPYSFNKEEISQQIKSNEQSVNFLLRLFKELDFRWSKENIYYFPNLESKIFYTGYWGIGFSCEAGVYNVLLKQDSSYGLLVHENSHSLLRKNELTFSSFFDEGIARYAEAMATDEKMNNKKTVELLREGKLFPLEKMLDFKIGNNPMETEVGYPASGSFVEFLIIKYGLEIIHRLNEKALNPISKKELVNNEEEWLNWLKREYDSQ